MRIRFPLTAISIAMLPVLHACVDTTKSPAVGQAELAPLTGATWVLTDAKAVGGRALKLSPRTRRWASSRVPALCGALPCACALMAALLIPPCLTR
jgi:hypothetical protein